MGNKLVINTEKFLEYCLRNAATAQEYEDNAWKERRYEDALEQQKERLNWEFLYNVCTGSEGTDIADYMEEVNEPKWNKFPEVMPERADEYLVTLEYTEKIRNEEIPAEIDGEENPEAWIDGKTVREVTTRYFGSCYSWFMDDYDGKREMWFTEQMLSSYGEHVIAWMELPKMSEAFEEGALEE